MISARVMKVTRIGWLQGRLLPAEWTESKVRYVAPGMQAGEAITAEAIEPSGTYPVYGGNGLRGYTESKTHRGTRILIGRQGAQCGNVHLVSGEFWASEHAIVAGAAEMVDPRWLAHLLRVMKLGQYSQAAAQPGIGTAQISALPVPLPPFEEQRSIADYLDREAARIDTLIEEQQRLIEMLREFRRAVVDQALSHGLDAEFDYTSDPWLPVLPIGWKAVSTKRLLSFGPSNGVSPEAGVVGDLRTLSLGSVRDGKVSMGIDVTKFVDRVAVPRLDDLRLRDGDILLVRGNGNVNLVGRAGLVGPEFDTEEYIYPDLLIRLRVGASMIPAFFVSAFNSTATRAQIETRARTAVGTYKVAAGDVRAIVLPAPPLSEQQRIVAYLNKQTEKIDTLITETDVFIELARERRAALITAAVTGQIDVREMA